MRLITRLPSKMWVLLSIEMTDEEAEVRGVGTDLETLKRHAAAIETSEEFFDMPPFTGEVQDDGSVVWVWKARRYEWRIGKVRVMR